VPYLWFRPNQSTDWRPLEASGPALAIDSQAAAVRPLQAARDAAADAVIIRSDAAAQPRFVLLIPSGLLARVNGAPLPSGIHQLADRDAIHLGDAPPVFFSADARPVVEPYPGAADVAFCARCKSEIVPGTPACRCPGCGLWFHQSEEFPCWTFSDHCVCGFPTALDGGPRWSPEDL